MTQAQRTSIGPNTRITLKCQKSTSWRNSFFISLITIYVLTRPRRADTLPLSCVAAHTAMQLDSLLSLELPKAPGLGQPRHSSPRLHHLTRETSTSSLTLLANRCRRPTWRYPLPSAIRVIIAHLRIMTNPRLYLFCLQTVSQVAIQVPCTAPALRIRRTQGRSQKIMARVLLQQIVRQRQRRKI